MPDASTLSDRDLEIEIALLVFPERYANGNPNPAYLAALYAPLFASSIDAVKQAEEKLEKAGWHLRVETVMRAETRTVAATWYAMPIRARHVATAVAPTEARARAEACLAALLALAASTPAEPEEK